MNKRVQAFLAKMQEKELDGIIINNLKNVYYLTGFWGSNGTVFISRDRQILVTDSRYIIAAKQETSGFEIVADRDELAVIAGIVKDMACLVSVLRMRFRCLIITVCRQPLKELTCFHRLSLLKVFE
ncbi:Xaa-Pro dipeptidase [Streptococcus mitis 11/5]|uniref:Xaa-Pro dipeptidase n=1 Tax=Streptococcus mitis 11/5 TaxID=1239792 RepID=R0LKG8_STRMT|nr:Xaa-Pro dipeptidase [Streptococcus mitis 11/5]